MGATDRDVCATDGCHRAAVEYFESGGIGSRYCRDCAANVRSIAQAMTQDKPPEWAVRMADETWQVMGFVNDRLNKKPLLALALSQAYERGQVENRLLLQGVAQSLEAAIYEYEARKIYPGAREIMRAQIEAIRSLPIDSAGKDGK